MTQPVEIYTRTQYIAYFSMEIALHADIPTSGGLGMVAGDTMRSAADLARSTLGASTTRHAAPLRQRRLHAVTRGVRRAIMATTFPSAAVSQAPGTGRGRSTRAVRSERGRYVTAERHRTMRRIALIGLAACLAAGPGRAQFGGDDARPGVVLGVNTNLAAGAAALQRGRYDEAIDLTKRGLESAAVDSPARAAGHANLCSAYVSKQQPDAAIPHCDEALRIDDRSWRAYTTRARAYLLKGMYGRARLDNDAAAAISPNAAHVRMMAGILNEIQLEPSIRIEEHQ